MTDSNLIDLSESTRKSIENNFPDYMFEPCEESKASPQDPRVLKLQLIDAQSHKFRITRGWWVTAHGVWHVTLGLSQSHVVGEGYAPAYEVVPVKL